MIETFFAILCWVSMLAGVASLATLAVNGPPLDIGRLKTYRIAAISNAAFAVAFGIVEWVRDHPTYVVTGFATALVMVGLTYTAFGQIWKADQEDASFVPFEVPDTERDAAHRVD